MYLKKIFGIFIVTLLIVTFLMPIVIGHENKNVIQMSIVSIDPEAPDPPTITGPIEGKLNIRYTYEIISEDPQCDNICYTVMCSDLPLIYKSQYCESGHVLVYNHSWDDFYQMEPPYFITAKATDCQGHESEWSSIEISIPKNKIINNLILDRLLIRFPILKFLI